MSGIPNVDKMDIYDMLEFMGAEGRNALIGQMDQQMDSMQDSIIAQAAAGYIKDAYTHIGIDTDQIETTYILHTEPRCWHLHSRNGSKYTGRTAGITCRCRCRTQTS